MSKDGESPSPREQLLADLDLAAALRDLGFTEPSALQRTLRLGQSVESFLRTIGGPASPILPGARPRFEKVMEGGKHVRTRDHRLGLEWDVTDFGGKRMEFDEAVKSCEKLGPGWRLPTVQELLSLVDYTKSDPATDEDAFPNTGTDYYYRTSTPYTPTPGGSWGVTFSGGHSNYLNPDNRHCVRAVRASQS